MKPLLFAALALASPALLAAPPAPRIDYHQHLISPAFAAIVQMPISGLVEEPTARGTLCSSASQEMGSRKDRIKEMRAEEAKDLLVFDRLLPRLFFAVFATDLRS